MWQGLYKPNPSCGGQRNPLKTSQSYGRIFVSVSVSPILLRYLINTLRFLRLRLGALTLGQSIYYGNSRDTIPQVAVNQLVWVTPTLVVVE